MSKALHPQAKFDPIPPDLDLHALVDRTPNFDWVVRISLSQIRRLGPSGFEKLVQLHVIEGGRPLVIEGWDRVLPPDLFSAKWLEKTYDKKQENVRDITAQSDIPMTTGHYLRSMRQLTNQWSPTNFRDERRQRLYLKDVDCPPEWLEHLRKVIPPNVFYMDENISANPAAENRGDDIFGAPEKTAAVAGDLMSSLPEEMRAQNLMCYIGHEGTYTPAHREMCASLGQNIMVEASEDGHGEKAGSSIWFMTETKDREVVREYFLSMLGHDIEIEKHFAQINAWKKANFPVYVVEQRAGDFILVPPLAPHQVWNRGTRTIKVAWNRTTVETLDLALHEALPRARLVCRDEQYKNKAIIYYTLDKYYKELHGAEESSEVGFLGLGQELMQNSARTKQMAGDFRRLFGLFTEVLIDEMFAHKQADIEYVPFDSNITCSYCRSNIFNRFLTCKCCVRQLINGDEDTYDICMECYAMGRSCVCISGLQWCEQWRWADLVEKHETWRAMVVKQDGFVDLEYSPQPLEVARRRSGKKSVAQVCQEQLRRRPWNDITKPPEAPAEESEPEPEVDENGRLKKKKKPSRKPKKGDVYRCHVCCHKDYTYKLNFCTTCTEAYCYGVLWRAFDMMPQAAMEAENWQCPKCLNICNCGTCRRNGNTTPYVPKNTLLGHDTRPIADDRSVESIVDFRMHNLSWLKAAGEENRSKDSRRMQRLREQADAEKAKDPLAHIDAADDAPHEMDSALQDSIMNGYGDQSHILGQNSYADGGPSTAQAADGRAETANASGTQDSQNGGEGNSAYPDPPMMAGGRMMGMGFYEQDESADKILFDAFKMPSDDIFNNEPQVSAFVKKTLRLAKRKARLENDDDPDFRGPQSRHRKKPKTGNIDQLVNLDPALLGSLGDPSSSTPTRPSARDSAREHSTDGAAKGDKTRPAQQQARPARPPLPVDSLRPTLRHAKPMTSYVEAEEPLDDPDDTVPVRVLGAGGDDVQDLESDPLDLAAHAVRALTGLPNNENENPPPDASTSTPLPSGKRRGRPPRHSLDSINTPSSATKDPKRRGRPPGWRKRSLLESVENNEDTAVPDAADAGGMGVDDATPAQLDGAVRDKNTPASEQAPAATGTGRKRGRPPGRRMTQPASTEDDRVETIPTPSTNLPPRRRGRPPAAATATRKQAEAEESSEPAVPPSGSLLSLAERMALKGKKVKVRARASRDSAGAPKTGSPATATPAGMRSGAGTPVPANAKVAAMPVVETAAEPATAETALPKRGRGELEDKDFAPAPEGDDSEGSKSDATPEPEPERAPAPSAKKRPTVVRLDFSSESEDTGSMASDGSDDDDADERGGPKRRFVAVNGRGRGRARGRGRGRARGGRARGSLRGRA
ncbi:hypothetical protein DL762_008080 [Monosporascus cannonballus]|uniref:JmjC domain-containing protein n=1 Tax=Monosporascus cannonballus TaxID=155416 RepID=A0ABY0GYA2_9PEZI|nr:hypothetical protein DL762_008080 [Monosporascus cannonballus]RYO84699.1 hypothetical protein DL763_007384 [Monosporascus cannonballus]